MKKRLQLRHILGAVVCGVILFGSPAYANNMNVQTHTKSEITSYINATKDNITSTTTFAVTPVLNNLTDVSAIGILSDETAQSALVRLNQYRYIAGLDADVTLDAEYGKKAQAAAFINAVGQGGLSHSPSQPSGMSDTLYSLCKEGAGSTNLGAGYGNLPYAIDGWVNDGGVDSLGHRRWVLNPGMTKTGFGLVKNSSSYYGTYTAMYAFDRNRSSSYKNVAWPAQLTPLSYFDVSEVWSLSTGKAETESAITVVVIRQKDNKSWTFTSSNGLTVNNDGYGQKGCVMFTPSAIGSLADGDVFTVNITGLADGDLSYKVEFFDETKAAGPSSTTGTNNNSNTNSSNTNNSNSNTGGSSSNTNNSTNKNTTGSTNVSTGNGTANTSSLKTKVSGFKATAGKRKITLKWKKKSGISGYQLQISTKKSFKTKQTYTIGKNTTKKTITKYKGKKLGKKKKYYIRIRAYVKGTNSKGKSVKKYSKWVTVNKKTK